MKWLVTETLTSFFDPSAEEYKDLIPDSDAIRTYQDISILPTKSFDSDEPIEIDNLFGTGVPTISSEVGISSPFDIPEQIRRGFFQQKVINTALISYVRWVLELMLLGNNQQHPIEWLMENALFLLDIKPESGNTLFPRSSAEGRNIKSIWNNANALVAEVDTTTMNYATNAASFGTDFPSHDVWEQEVKEAGKGADGDCQYLVMHNWFRDILGYPIAKLDYFGTIFFQDLTPVFDETDIKMSSLQRTLKINKKRTGFSLPLLNQLSIADLALPENQGRDLYHFLMFGYDGLNTRNAPAFSTSSDFSPNSMQAYLDPSLTPNRGLQSAFISRSETTETVDALNYLIVTNYVLVLPLDIFNYYDGLTVEYSVNGGYFKPLTHINDVPGFDSVAAYGEYMKDRQNAASSLVYDEKGRALLISPRFKEGYNNVAFKFTDTFGGVFYKDIQVMQITVPPFIKPVYPLMNQYLPAGPFEAVVQCQDIVNGAIKPENWFTDAGFTVKLDGSDVSFTRDQADYSVRVPLSGLEEGNHRLEVTVNVYGLESSNGWQFWVDGTEPAVSFPERRIFSNKAEQNNGGVAVHIADTVPFRYPGVDYPVDTVYLSDLSIDIRKSGSLIENLVDKHNTRLGPYAVSWNGWKDGSPVSHGIYELAVTAKDRVGNASVSESEVIIDNEAPVFENIGYNTDLVNLNSGLLEITYRLGLDPWETKGSIEVEMRNILTGERFTLTTTTEGGVDGAYTLAYFVEGVNVLKDGEYDIAVTAVDEIGNRGNPVTFQGIVVDRTRPKVVHAYAVPFVLDAGSDTVALNLLANEERDIPGNVSSALNLSVDLFDLYGETIPEFTHYETYVSADVPFTGSFTVPAGLKDGKYFLSVNVKDKHDNTTTELVAFVKNAVPPEITYPDENDLIDGFTVIHGNVTDPRWSNSLSFLRYELWYRNGYYETPADLSDLSEWESSAVTVPEYQRTAGSPDNYGRFTVEGGGALGVLDTGALPEGLVTVLLISREEGGYAIATTRTFRVLQGAVSYEINLEIDPSLKTGTPFFDLTSGGDIDVTYSVTQSLDNPVDIHTSILSDAGNVIKQYSYYNVLKNDIRGKPAIDASDKGIYVWQDTDGKLYLHFQNDASGTASFFMSLESSSPLNGFTDGSGGPIADPAGLVQGGTMLVLSRSLEAGDAYSIGFDLASGSSLKVIATVDNQLPSIYLGSQKTENTSGNLTLFPGTDYPPVIWDGKDEWGRFVENGAYSVSMEAFGDKGGYDADGCVLNISTPFLLTALQVDNTTLQPGLDTLDTANGTLTLNKPCTVSISVEDAFGAKVRDIVPVPVYLRNAGIVTFSWNGTDAENRIVDEGLYEFKVVCNAADGSLPIVVDGASYGQLNLAVSHTQGIDPSVTAELLPFPGAETYDGKELVRGDSSYRTVITPNGQYLPDKEVAVEFAGKGTQVVDAYPDLNYMAAFRTNFSELWTQIIAGMTVNIYGNYGKTFTREELIGFVLFPECFQTSYYLSAPSYTASIYLDSKPRVFRVLSYTITPSGESMDPLPPNNTIDFDVEISGTLQLDGYKLVSGTVYPDPSCLLASPRNYSNVAIPIGNLYHTVAGTSATVQLGNRYVSMNYRSVSLRSISYGAINRSIGQQSVPYTAVVNIRAFISSDIYAKYFSFCDGVAVMGPDIKEDPNQIYAHKTPYVNQLSLVNHNLITDPLTSTGMGSVDPVEVWRQNPHYYLYYLGEDYANPSPGDDPASSFEDKFTFKPITITGFHGGDGHIDKPNLPSRVQYWDLTNGVPPGSLVDGKVSFTISKIGSTRYDVSVSSSAYDKILYPFPPTVTAAELGTAHTIGDPQMGIPITNINGTRDNASLMPNYALTPANVVYPPGGDFRVIMNTGLIYQNATGYSGSIDGTELLLEANTTLPETVAMKEFEVTEAIANDPTVVFSGLAGTKLNFATGSFPDLNIEDSHIALIGSADWSLTEDTQTGLPYLFEGPRSLDLEYLNRYGTIQDSRISDFYAFSDSENLVPRNMFHTTDVGEHMDNADIVLDPTVRDYTASGKPQGYDVELFGVDNAPYTGTEVKSVAHFGKGLKLSDGYTLALSDASPKRLISVYGRGEGTISLHYLGQDQSWHPIPVYGSDAGESILTYWDVTGLSGQYTLRLVSDSGGRKNVVFKEVYIGYKINTSSDDVLLASPGGNATLIFPIGSVTGDIVANIDAVDIADIKDIAVLPALAPVGKVIKLTPDGIEFGSVQPQLQFTYNKNQMDEDGINPAELVIYTLSTAGELTPLSTVKQLIKVVYDDNGEVIDETVKWDSSIDPPKDPNLIDYTYVRAWSQVSHFSYYLVIEGVVKGKPVPDSQDMSTSATLVSITGAADPNTELIAYVIDSPYFNPSSGSYSPAAFTFTDPTGRFVFENLTLPFEGRNFIFIGYTQAAASEYAKVIALRDTTPPVFTMDDNYRYISPNEDGEHDYLDVKLTSNEAGRFKFRVFDTQNGRLVFEKTLDNVENTEVRYLYYGGEYGGTVLPDGEYYFTVSAFDSLGNNAVQGVFTLAIDTTAPEIQIVFSPLGLSPKNQDGTYDTADIHLKTSEPIDITSWIGNYTYPHICNPEESRHIEDTSFVISWNGLDNTGSYMRDGKYYLEVVSEDPAGNKSTTTYYDFPILMDNVKPATLMETSIPLLQTPDAIYADDRHVFTWSAEDGLSGVSEIRISIDGMPIGETTFVFTYTGEHHIEYYSIDKLGNTEETHTLNVTTPIPDLTPPVTTMTPSYEPFVKDGFDYFRGDVLFSLHADDPLGEMETFASGVESIRYRIDNGIEKQYMNGYISAPDSGFHEIYYYAVDKAGNVEIENRYAFFIDNESPQTSLYPRDEQAVYMEGQLLIRESAYLVLESSDDLSGLNRILYRVDAGPWAVYSEPFSLTDGERNLYYYAEDNLGNREATLHRVILVETDYGTSSLDTRIGTKLQKNIETFDFTRDYLFFLSDYKREKSHIFRIDADPWNMRDGDRFQWDEKNGRNSLRLSLSKQERKELKCNESYVVTTENRTGGWEVFVYDAGKRNQWGDRISVGTGEHHGLVVTDAFAYWIKSASGGSTIQRYSFDTKFTVNLFDTGENIENIRYENGRLGFILNNGARQALYQLKGSEAEFIREADLASGAVNSFSVNDTFLVLEKNGTESNIEVYLRENGNAILLDTFTGFEPILRDYQVYYMGNIDEKDRLSRYTIINRQHSRITASDEILDLKIDEEGNLGYKEIEGETRSRNGKHFYNHGKREKQQVIFLDKKDSEALVDDIQVNGADEGFSYNLFFDEKDLVYTDDDVTFSDLDFYPWFSKTQQIQTAGTMVPNGNAAFIRFTAKQNIFVVIMKKHNSRNSIPGMHKPSKSSSFNGYRFTFERFNEGDTFTLPFDSDWELMPVIIVMKR